MLLLRGSLPRLFMSFPAGKPYNQVAPQSYFAVPWHHLQPPLWVTTHGLQCLGSGCLDDYQPGLHYLNSLKAFAMASCSYNIHNRKMLKKETAVLYWVFRRVSDLKRNITIDFEWRTSSLQKLKGLNCGMMALLKASQMRDWPKSFPPVNSLTESSQAPMHCSAVNK